MNLRSASIFQKDSKENSLRKSHEQSSTETIGFLKQQNQRQPLTKDMQKSYFHQQDQSKEKGLLQNLQVPSKNSIQQNIPFSNPPSLKRRECYSQSYYPLPQKRNLLTPSQQNFNNSYQQPYYEQSQLKQPNFSYASPFICISQQLYYVPQSYDNCPKNPNYSNTSSFDRNQKENYKNLSCEIVEQPSISRKQPQYLPLNQEVPACQPQYCSLADKERNSQKICSPQYIPEFRYEEDIDNNNTKQNFNINIQLVQSLCTQVQDQLSKSFKLTDEQIKDPIENVPLALNDSKQNAATNKSTQGQVTDDNFEITQDEKKKLTHTDDLLKLLKKQNVTVSYIESSSNSLVSELIQDKANSNKGEAIVKEIFHWPNGDHSDHCFELQNEVNILNILKHKYILELIQKKIIKLPKSCCVFMSKAKMDLFDFSLLRKNTSDINRSSFQYMKIGFHQVTQALHYLHCHKNMIHGDIKPENILVFSNTLFKLADFGFAKVCSAFKTRSEFIKRFCDRSLKYYPPEFIEALEDEEYELSTLNEFKADVFALGISIFYCFFKTTPFGEEKFYCRFKRQIDATINQKGKPKENEYVDSRKYYHKADSIYGILYSKKKKNYFWNCFSKEENWILKSALSQKEYSMLQELIIQCITPDLQSRFNIVQVLNHSFFKSL